MLMVDTTICVCYLACVTFMQWVSMMEKRQHSNYVTDLRHLGLRVLQGWLGN